MIVDAHTHIFPPEIRENRQEFFDNEPAFQLLYESPKARLVGAAELVDTMDAQGVDVSVVFGFPWQNGATSKRNNDYVMEAVRRYPGRLAGFCCLDPFMADAAGEVDRCLTGGLSGVGELAFYQSGIEQEAVNRLAPVMALCREREVPVMIHTNEPVGHIYPGKTPNTLVQIYNLVKAFPDNRLILAHWGGGLFFYNSLKREVKDQLKNVWFDTAASPFLYDPAIYRLAAELAGPDKILLGTDFPLLKPERYFKEIEQAGVSTAQAEGICGQNAAALLNLKSQI